VPEGKADLNVRNSPTALSPAGLTPLPASMKPLIVRGWHIAADASVRPAPFYDLIVSAPPAEAGQPPVELKKLLVEPTAAWFRPEPDSPEPTVLVSVP
jgi:hypothetical protein